jgi:DNA-binding beta-propeller fold protein YncE
LQPDAGFNASVWVLTCRAHLPERAIRVACNPYVLAVTPDGKTVWVGSNNSLTPISLTPISTVSNTAGKPIKIRSPIIEIAVAP